MRPVSHVDVGLGRTPARGRPRANARLAVYFVVLASAGLLLARLPVLARRSFDPDEFEHAHAAWCAFKGMLPYRDFFEHHTPWYYYTLRPFFHWLAVDASFESARSFLLFGRGLSLLLATVAVVLVALIGRLWQDGRVGVVAGLFLVGQPFFFQKTLEIRPDVLALPFFLGSLWLLLRGLATDGERAGRSLWFFLAGGLSLGAAVMSTQKMLFVLPGALAGLVIWSLFGGRAGKRVGVPAPLRRSNGHQSGRTRALLTLAFLVSVGVPAVLTWAAFAVQHAGGEFIVNNFLLNADWKHVEAEQLHKLLKTSRLVLVLALLGASVASYRFFRSERRPYGGIVLLCTLAGLFAGLLVVPVAHRQYYLMPLPIICLFAARGLSFLIERARVGARPWLLVLATAAFAVLPALDLQAAAKLRDDRQLAKLRYVFANTKPTDVVMDGWEGTGVFRPHALYHFFLHRELLAMLPRDQVDAYLDALESGRIRPRLIAMDENLVALGPRFLRFVKGNYVRGDMAGLDRRTSADWPRFFKKLLKRDDVAWEGFYFARDGLD